MTIKAFFSLSRAAPLDGWFRSVLMMLVIFSGGSVSVVQAGPFPPAGDDKFHSMGKFSISLLDGGSWSVELTGPTCVARSSSHSQGLGPLVPSSVLGDGSLCAGSPSAATSDAEIEPFFPFDFNAGGGANEVHTEIVEMELTDSVVKLQAGAPLLSLPPPEGIDCRLQSELNLGRNLERSLGEVEARGGSGFPADSFFNLFLAMETPFGNLFNVSPLLVRANGLKGFPPYRKTYIHGFNLLGKVRLYDCEEGCFRGTIAQGSHRVDKVSGGSAPSLARSRSLLPIVFSVDENAEGLLDPIRPEMFAPDWNCHPHPQDVYYFGLTERTEGELFQAAHVANVNLKLRRALGLIEEDNIISLSFGQDHGKILLFSVDPEAQGAAGTAVEFNSTNSPVEEIPLAGIDPTKRPSNGGGDPGNEAAGDIYVSKLFSQFGPELLEPIKDCAFDEAAKEFVVPARTSKNVVGYDESSLGLQAPAINYSVNNSPEDNEDDLDALEASDPTEVDSNQDSVIDPERFVFFTLSANSPSLEARMPEFEFQANDILVATAPEEPDEFTFEIYADGIEDIGLLEGDVIDALVLWDESPHGVLDELDEALFSLAAGSPSLNAKANPNMPGAGPFSPGDVFRIKFSSKKTILLYAKASRLGLQKEDELNALDIAPPPPPPPPPCSVTLIDNAFTATVSNGTVNLAWETADEDKNAGFVVWRGQLKADKTECSQNMDDYTEVRPLNPKKEDLVVAIGSGSPYSYQDQEVTSGNTYCYALEDVELKGKRTHHLDSIISASVP